VDSSIIFANFSEMKGSFCPSGPARIQQIAFICRPFIICAKLMKFYLPNPGTYGLMFVIPGQQFRSSNRASVRIV
jgi:hypothetical protein